MYTSLIVIVIIPLLPIHSFILMYLLIHSIYSHRFVFKYVTYSYYNSIIQWRYRA